MSIACKVRPIGGEVLLPDGYRRCEYLESTGTQWVVTNEFKPDYIEAEFIFQFIQITGVRQLFGLSSASPYFGINAAGNWDKLNTPADLDIHRLTMAMNCQSGEYYTILDDTRKDGEAGDWWNPETVRWICNPFALDRTGSFPCHIRSYGAKVTGDNNLLCNLIPCLDDKGKPCMFDTVSRTPYYNKGTGDFLYKLKTPITRKLPRGYYPLDYLEGTGTQWIDTEVKLSNESEVRCEFMRLAVTDKTQNLYGDETDKNSRFSCFFNIGASNRSRWDFAEQMIPYVNPLETLTKYISIHNATGVSLNDLQIVNFASAEPFETGASLRLFGIISIYCAQARVYSFTISRSGVPQLDFQPCLDPTGKPCMWDYVTRRPFYNQDTTGPDFLYG